ncbi:MAG: DoxX family protein [Polyangiales bacterium]
MVDLRRWVALPEAPVHAARAIAALAQCATVLVTWKLWSVRLEPPMLPIGPAMAVPFGHALIATALVSIPFARVGSIAHALVFALAIAADLNRVQPSPFCFAIILLGTSFGARGWVIARVALAALWFYAGLNKLLSPGWFTGTAPWLLSALTRTPTAMVTKWFPWVIAGGEMTLGLLVLLPWTRRLAALGAVLLHVGILFDLGPWGHKWNEAVWPWNAGLALLAPFLLWPFRKESLRETARQSHPLALAVCAWLALAPLLWHVGLYPAYFSHHLYSEDLPTSRWCGEDGCANERANDEVYAALKVPLSPSIPIIRAYFLARCHRGEYLVVEETRRWLRNRGQGQITVPCAR